MIAYIFNLLRSKTAKDSLLLLLGIVLSTILGFLLMVILTRNMSTLEFGIFITALTFTQLASDLSELGINSAALNFLSSAKGVKKYIFIKTTFIFKFTVALIMSIGVFLLAYPVANFVFKNVFIVPFLQISSIGVFFTTFITWGQSIFQSEKKFLLSMITGSSINVLRIFMVILLLASGFFSVISAYFAMQIILLVSVLFLIYKIRLKFLSVKTTSSDFKKISTFGLPIGFGFAIAAVYTKLDQILIFNMAGAKEAGIYGLAIRVASALIFASTALNSAVTPRFASLHPGDFTPYFKKVVLTSLGLGTLSVGVILISPYVLPLIFGTKFNDSIIPFQILSIGAIFFILSSPFYSAILYRFKKPKFSLYIALLSLLILIFLLNLLIPLYQSIGAAYSVTVVYGLQLTIAALYFYYLNKKA